MKKWWRANRQKIYKSVARPLAKMFLSTVRVRFINPEVLESCKTSFLVSGLHKNGLAAVHMFRNRSYLVMVSHSRDGDLQAHLYSSLGFRIIRGSSSKGGERATIEFIRLLRSERCGVVMAIDGPKGPPEVAKGGAILMAKKSGAAIIPVGVCANRQWRLKSWDRFMVPKPFSTINCYFGTPIYVPQELSDEQFEEIRLTLQNAILEAEAIAAEHASAKK